MRRPRTIVGLIAEVMRVRGFGRVVWVAVASLATLASIAMALHARRPVLTNRTLAGREAVEWWSEPVDTSTFLGDASVIATPRGWLLAWMRWEAGHPTTIHVAALDRSGELRGAPVTVSSSELVSRHPRLARGPRGNALVWASTAPRTFEPHAWLAVIDDDARVTLAARRVGAPDDETLAPQVASDGEGWGVGWSRLRPTRGYTLVRLAADGSSRGAPTSLDDRDAWFPSSLVWVGSSWLVVQSELRPRADASAVKLTWIERSGRVIERRVLARSSGELGEITATARDSSAWVVWGEDAGFGVRHDPRLARLDERSIAQPPRALGPRRSGSVPAIACAGDGCTLAWTEVPERGDEPVFYVQRVDVDGAPRGAPRRIGGERHAWPRFAASLASSLDEREALAVWPAAHANRGGLLLVRLDADGAPMGPPREFHP